MSGRNSTYRPVQICGAGSKETWLKLPALVQVKPDGDILPVRAPYADCADGTIGANYLSSKQGIWFTLADCLAAQILTGKPVKVLRAIVFRPLGPQGGLQKVEIAKDRVIDPYKDDFYKELIELRQELKCLRSGATGKEREELEVQQNSVKIATNATSYGIFAEINVNERPQTALARIFGACNRPFLLTTDKDEQPGRFFHPLLAATITGAARLMLAITERLVTDAGLEWAFCDTDSMAIAKPKGMSTKVFHEKANEVVGWFRRLNPYNFDTDILKIEDVNFGLKDPAIREPLFVWAVSAKRYVLFNIQNGVPVVRKASAHGLGHFRDAYDKDSSAPGIPAPQDKLSKIGVHLWQHDLWWTIAKAAIDEKSDHELKFEFHPALKRPAIGRYAATTPKILKWFNDYNSSRPYSDQVKPFGFVNSLFAQNTTLDETSPNERQKSTKETTAVRPVGPFENDPKRAAKLAFDRLTGRSVPAKQLKTYLEALAQYHLHPEDKFLNGDFIDRGPTRRRHVVVTEIQYIGKESNKWEEQFYLGFNPEAEIRYGARPATRKSIARGLRKLVERLGQRAAANEIGISRGKLSKLQGSDFLGCSPEFMQRISRIVGAANSKLNQRNRQNSELLRLAKAKIKKIGISTLAKEMRVDPSNLAKAINSKRPICSSLRIGLNDYFCLS